MICPPPGTDLDTVALHEAGHTLALDYEGKLYLFKGANYASYDWAADRGDPGYPLPIEFNWF